KLMRKGVTAVQNIQLLKWCLELRIQPVWGLLWGFPNEDPRDYQEMVRLIPLITHLPPPSGFGRIRFDRFSPNYMEAEKFGFINVAAYPSYQYVYGLGNRQLADLAYFFCYDYADGRVPEEYTSGVAHKLSQWQAGHCNSALFHFKLGNEL